MGGRWESKTPDIAVERKSLAGSDNEPAAKKTCRQPFVRCERVFETAALTCRKVQTTQGSAT